MTRFEVAMTGSNTGTAQAQIVQIEELLHGFQTTHANDNVAPVPVRRFDHRPAVAACLAFFLFAPGCAAAAAFLLRSDGTVPPLVGPDYNPPIVAKSDRLPLGQWSLEAAQVLSPKDHARIAAALAAEDRNFLQPTLIRGSLEDGTLTTFTEPAVIAQSDRSEPTAAPQKPRTKRHAKRTVPVRMAEAVPLPEPPEPTFFEKLFGTRNH